MISNQVINYILNTKDTSLIVLNNLTDKYFPDYKKEFNFILNHFKQYGNIPDKETFLNVFPDFDLIEVNESPKYLIEELFRDYQKNQLAYTFNNIRKYLIEGDTEKAVETYQSSYENISTGISLQSVDILKDTSRYNDYVDRLSDFDKYYVRTGFPELDGIIGGWDREEELGLIVARTNKGKCLKKGTNVLMADGTLKRVEDIRVGDKVQSLNCINTVLGLHKGFSKGYKIIPNIGEPFTVSENHILTLMKLRSYWDKDKKQMLTKNEHDLIDISIEDYLKLPDKKRNIYYSLYKPSINYSTKDQKIPPYILGLWLGDGTKNKVEIASMDDVIIEEWTNYASQHNLIVWKSKDTLIPSKKHVSKAHIYSITKGNKGCGKNSVLEDFRSYDLINNKHIPLNYLTGDKNQRLELLAGMLDTDGYYNKKDNYELTLSDPILIKQFAQLARGLGYRISNIRERKIENTYIKYTFNIYGPHLEDIPVRLERKKAASNPNLKRQLVLTGFKVELVNEIEYYGFEVDGDHRFMLGDNTLTHNSWIQLKMALAAAEQGLTVGYYSGEMSEKKVGYRIDTLLQHLPNGSLIHGNPNIQADYQTYINNLPNRLKGSIKIITPLTIGGSAGVNALRAFIEKDKLDILFIDQISLMDDDRHAKNPVEKVNNIANDLKLLQVMKKIPIISVSQQNRNKNDDGDDTIDTSQVALSDKLAQNSTFILGITRDKKDNSLTTLHIIKSRDSVVGNKITYKVDFNRGEFTYIPEGNEKIDKEENYNDRYKTPINNSEEVFD